MTPSHQDDIPSSQHLPFLHYLLTPGLQLRPHVDGRQIEPLPKELEHTLFLKEQRNMVSGRNIVDTKDLTGGDMAEHGDFFHSGGKKLLCASTGNEIGKKS